MDTETLPPADHPSGEELHTVGEVAALARVTVRTLHHYDRIGLLVPSRRSDNDYRLYGYEDLERLRQILLLRELGFGLDAIGQMLDAGAYDQRRALIAQRELLRERQHRTERIIAGVDRALEAMEEERPMAKGEMFEGLEDFDHEQYEEEAHERWGGTDAYRESMRRTRSYTRDDWTRIKAEGEDVMGRLTGLLEEGAHAANRAARGLAEEHRRHIDRWFYPCSHAMHAGLADMYVGRPALHGVFREAWPRAGGVLPGGDPGKCGAPEERPVARTYMAIIKQYR